MLQIKLFVRHESPPSTANQSMFAELNEWQITNTTNREHKSFSPCHFEYIRPNQTFVVRPDGLYSLNRLCINILAQSSNRQYVAHNSSPLRLKQITSELHLMMMWTSRGIRCGMRWTCRRTALENASIIFEAETDVANIQNACICIPAIPLLHPQAGRLPHTPVDGKASVFPRPMHFSSSTVRAKSRKLDAYSCWTYGDGWERPTQSEMECNARWLRMHGRRATMNNN